MERDNPHDDAHPKVENSAKRQKISEHGMFDIGGSSSGQDYKSKPEIEERLKCHDQMRRWEMYVNGRPLGSRMERPE
nr:hypothetical protein [Tanacetum cinerariifolium]